MVATLIVVFFFFNDTATTEIYTLSLHDALPISFLTLTSSFMQISQKLAKSVLWGGLGRWEEEGREIGRAHV